jgi:hypothetical protein
MRSSTRKRSRRRGRCPRRWWPKKILRRGKSASERWGPASRPSLRATSRPEDAPRGMEFLYDLNRLNVATSRARCACILVASPRLLEPDCKTPRQMRLANAMCRYWERRGGESRGDRLAGATQDPDPSVRQLAEEVKVLPPDAHVVEARRLLASAAGRYYRLVLAVGPAGSGKTPLLRRLAEDHGAPVISVSRQVSERLIDLPRRQRALETSSLFSELVDGSRDVVVLLDNLELLFSPELGQDVLRLLQSSSRNRTLLAAWPGDFIGDVLSYGRSGHPEHVRYLKPDAEILNVGSKADDPVHTKAETGDY